MLSRCDIQLVSFSFCVIHQPMPKICSKKLWPNRCQTIDLTAHRLVRINWCFHRWVRVFGFWTVLGYDVVRFSELNGGAGDEAWRNVGVSPGAITPSSVPKGNFVTKRFDRFARSSGFFSSKLRRRRPRYGGDAGSFGPRESFLRKIARILFLFQSLIVLIDR